MLLGTIILISFVTSLLVPAFGTSAYLLRLLSDSTYIIVAAVGITLVILVAEIDVSVGSMLAVVSVVAGEVAIAGWPIASVIALCLIVGAAMGTLNGLIVTRLNVPSIVTTLGMMSVLRGLVLLVTKGNWIQNIPYSYKAISKTVLMGVSLPIWITIMVVLLIQWFLTQTRFGREIYAVGSNSDKAVADGINVSRVKVLVFTMMGIAIGISGILSSSRFSVIQTTTGVGFEFEAISAAVVGGTSILGGRGSIFGSVLGALFIRVLSASLVFLKVPPYWIQAIQGALILLAVSVYTGLDRRWFQFQSVRIRGESA